MLIDCLQQTSYSKAGSEAGYGSILCLSAVCRHCLRSVNESTSVGGKIGRGLSGPLLYQAGGHSNTKSEKMKQDVMSEFDSVRIEITAPGRSLIL